MNLLSNLKQYDAAIIVEALNFLYDVYSDYAFDYDFPVFVQGGFLNILKQIVPAVRSMVSMNFPHLFFFFTKNTLYI